MILIFNYRTAEFSLTTSLSPCDLTLSRYYVHVIGILLDTLELYLDHFCTSPHLRIKGRFFFISLDYIKKMFLKIQPHTHCFKGLFLLFRYSVVQGEQWKMAPSTSNHTTGTRQRKYILLYWYQSPPAHQNPNAALEVFKPRCLHHALCSSDCFSACCCSSHFCKKLQNSPSLIAQSQSLAYVPWTKPSSSALHVNDE